MVRPVALDHVVLRVPDVEAALGWYVDVLGLEGVRVDEWRSGAVPFPSARISAESIIDFVPRDEPLAGRGELDHLCIVIDGDLDVLLDDDRVEVLSQPTELFGARGEGLAAYVRDPAGVTVEVRTYR